MPVVLAPLIALLMRALSWLFLTKAGIWCVAILGTLGLGLATNEMVIEPLVDQATTAWGALPPEVAVWAKALGVLEFVSLVISAHLVYAATKAVSFVAKNRP